MTLDQALAKAAREIDRVCGQKMDETIFCMIASGVDEGAVLTFADWQREHYSEWRAATLHQIRDQLLDPTGWE